MRHLSDREERSALLRALRLGEGRPKIIVSLTGADASEMREQAGQFARHDHHFDIVELRLDHLDVGTDPNAAVALVRDVTSVLPSKPLLATFRSNREGGEKEITPKAYAALYSALLASTAVTLIDLELRSVEADADDVAPLCKLAAQVSVGVVISYHDFDKTPQTEQMIAILERQAQAGADICKIAVKPNSKVDVLRLLEASVHMRERYPERPLIAMSMGGLGVVSRLAGEVFGSCATFGSLGSGSAPGQLPVAHLRQTLETIGKALENS